MARLGIPIALALSFVPCSAGAQEPAPAAPDPIGALIQLEEDTAAGTEPEMLPGATAILPAEGAFLPGSPIVGALPPDDAPMLAPADFVAAANSAAFASSAPTGRTPDPLVTRLQVMLDRAGASPGVIDGIMGENVGKAIAAVEAMNGLAVDGQLDAEVWALLEARDPDPALVAHVLLPEDVAGPFLADLPDDFAALSAFDRLSFTSPLEALAERFHMDEDLLAALNPGAAFLPGDEIIVTDVGAPVEGAVTRLVADKATAQLLGYDVAGTLIVAYPATIGSDDLPSPTGVHTVGDVATDAEYWYRPDVNFQQGDNTEALRLAPGPNNPIGTTWIGLDAPTYGIHGTPEPSAIDKTNSHGCVRLTNWDVEELVGLVSNGVTVEFVDGVTATAEER